MSLPTLIQSIRLVRVQFWQNGNHPIALWSSEVIQQKINYLHNNPVQQGIAAKPEDYLYSSAYEFSEIKVLDL